MALLALLGSGGPPPGRARQGSAAGVGAGRGGLARRHRRRRAGGRGPRPARRRPGGRRRRTRRRPPARAGRPRAAAGGSDRRGTGTADARPRPGADARRGCGEPGRRHCVPVHPGLRAPGFGRGPHRRRPDHLAGTGVQHASAAAAALPGAGHGASLRADPDRNGLLLCPGGRRERAGRAARGPARRGAAAAPPGTDRAGRAGAAGDRVVGAAPDGSRAGRRVAGRRGRRPFPGGAPHPAALAAQAGDFPLPPSPSSAGALLGAVVQALRFRGRGRPGPRARLARLGPDRADPHARGAARGDRAAATGVDRLRRRRRSGGAARRRAAQSSRAAGSPRSTTPARRSASFSVHRVTGVAPAPVGKSRPGGQSDR